MDINQLMQYFNNILIIVWKVIVKWDIVYHNVIFFFRIMIKTYLTLC